MTEKDDMKKIVLSSMIGNGLEWFEFALYGNFVAIIGSLFFPASSPMTQLLAAFSVFASGCFMRPVGALLFGYIGDKFGRKKALSTAIIMMSIPTALIGVLPTYEDIGIASTIILVIIRLTQGLSLGGEFSGSIAFLIEHSPKKVRGLSGSTAMVSMNIGILLGLLTGIILKKILTPEQFLSFGWRLPFLMGLLIGFVGFYIRSKLHESPVYIKAKSSGKISIFPAKIICKYYLDKLFIGVALYITVCIPFHAQIIFLKPYMTNILNYTASDAMIVSFVSISVSTILMPLFGYWSDVVGRHKALTYACVGFILLSYPVFWLIHTGNVESACIGGIIFGALVGAYMAPMPATLAELFPTKVRYTGVGLSFNISVALFGGTLPAIATKAIEFTGNTYFIAFYIIAFCIITFIFALYGKKDTYQQTLEDDDNPKNSNSESDDDERSMQLA